MSGNATAGAVEQLRALREGCAFADLSASARIIARGPDLLDLLNRLSTKEVKSLGPGEGKLTTLTSNKGRIVALLAVYHLGDDGVLMLSAPGSAPRVIAHLNKYTFAERTGLEDAGDAWHGWGVLGPKAPEALEAAGLPVPEGMGVARGTIGGPDGTDDHQVLVLGPTPVAPTVYTVQSANADSRAKSAGADSDSSSGRSAHADSHPVAVALRHGVESCGGLDVRAETLAAWSILDGIPGAEELNEDHNPLEAGLWDSVDFDKGCYVGQEVVARLRTYDKVTRGLYGIVAAADPAIAPGAPLFDGDRKVGTITRVAPKPGDESRVVAMAYVKRAALAEGKALSVAAPEGSVTASPRELPISSD
ncbi:hypothetical protein ABI59_07840 [Acidobacteria bacterium Mor1]|nr:hypothetical protein ABI59_07840 [Acidobacteria bacterium Mor1]